KADVDVEPIEQRPGEPPEVGAARLRRAPARARGVPEVPAGTAVRRADDEGARRKPRPRLHPRDADPAVFERLAKRLGGVAPELRKLVEEEHAVVREAHLAGARRFAAADEPGFADGVMRRAVRPPRDDALVRLDEAGDAVDAGRLDRFFEGERWENGRQETREHGFARAGRPEHQ